MKEPKPMEEIHKIREKLHQENKSLSHKEHIAKIHREAAEAIKKYGIKVGRTANVRK